MQAPTPELVQSYNQADQIVTPGTPLSTTERCAKLLTDLLAKKEGVSNIDPVSASEIWYNAAPTQQIGQLKLRRLGDFIVRRYPLYDYHYSDFDIAHAHLDVLSSCGLDIVPYAYLKVDGDPSTKGYAISEYVPNARKINSLDEEQKQATIGDPLQKYLRWVKDSGQSHYLWDIFHPRQFSIQPGSTRPFLHDIDPFLEAARSSSAISFLIKSTLPYARY